eukprot:189937_1
MAGLGKRLKIGHQKTDSEALADLSSAFHDLDIDGEGLLDIASFQTALRMLGVTLPESELEKIFEVLDEDDTGLIAYDKLKEFMKMGKIPSTILSKVKGTKTSPMAKRTSIMFGAPPLGLLNGGLKDRTLSGSVLLSELKEEQKVEEPILDKARIKMIQRAVIVIKKSVMKNISRKEVVDFLVDKGMIRGDIDVAYQKAEVQVLSPEERIKYLSNLNKTCKQELKEQKELNDYLSQQVSQQTQEITDLRDLLKVVTDELINKQPNITDVMVSADAAAELTERIQLARKDLKEGEKQKDGRAVEVHKRDLKTLQLISKCLTKQQHFYANLYLHQLEVVIRESMPELVSFLKTYDAPEVEKVAKDD